MSERILACGSRTWTDKHRITTILGRFWTDHEAVLIHGDCRGADRIAGQVGHEFGWTVIPVPADWKRHGRKAGFVRNVQMLDMQPTRVIAFVRGESRGTMHTVNEARKRGITVHLVADPDYVVPA